MLINSINSMQMSMPTQYSQNTQATSATMAPKTNTQNAYSAEEKAEKNDTGENEATEMNASAAQGTGQQVQVSTTAVQARIVQKSSNTNNDNAQMTSNKQMPDPVITLLKGLEKTSVKANAETYQPAKTMMQDQTAAMMGGAVDIKS